MIRVEYTIEPGWTHQAYSDVIEIDDEELEGLSPGQREEHITMVVEEAINNMCPWGWRELDASAEPQESPMSDARLAHTAPADATERGHDMAYRPHNQPRPDADRWECQRCGRIAYQAAGDAWGTAIIAQCIAPKPED